MFHRFLGLIAYYPKGLLLIAAAFSAIWERLTRELRWIFGSVVFASLSAGSFAAHPLASVQAR
jgi:hypothetical protein